MEAQPAAGAKENGGRYDGMRNCREGHPPVDPPTGPEYDARMPPEVKPTTSILRAVLLALALAGAAMPGVAWLLLRREGGSVPRAVVPPRSPGETPTFEAAHLKALEGKKVWAARVAGRPAITTYHERLDCPRLQAEQPIELDHAGQRMRRSDPVPLLARNGILATESGYRFFGTSCPDCRSASPPGDGCDR